MPGVRERLDALAAERGCSVADLVREAVTSYLSSGGDTWQGR